MTNMNLINDAVDLAVRCEEGSFMVEPTENFRARILDWYNHTDIAEAELLAAAALTGSFNPGLTLRDIEASRDFFFGDNIPFEYMGFNYSIQEIEEAQHDAAWR